MEIVRTPAGDVVALRGRFDADAVTGAGQQWERLAARARGDVHLDLTEVTFIDCCAIGTITFLFKRLAAQGRQLRLFGASGQPRKLLEFLRIDRVIALAPQRPPGLGVRPNGNGAAAAGRRVRFQTAPAAVRASNQGGEDHAARAAP